MAEVIGQSIDPVNPGVLGQPMNIDAPGTFAIGVKGDGGSGFPPPGGIPIGRQAIGVFGTCSDPRGVGVQGENTAGGNAGLFSGNVIISGHLTHGDSHCTGTVTVDVDLVLANGDCAEEFDLGTGASATPGTVMVLNSAGELQESVVAYDRRVAGVISGAGGYKPGIVLDKRISNKTRMPIGLLGKVACKVDASYAPIAVGDLLTTSPTPGHAMKATDSNKAFGSVLGKALRALDAGQELIPVLITLQ
jgi:hypothetical protein